jgi:adenine-specific DNA-methyltransferase
MDRLMHPLGNSRVDLNPHQVEAALFAIRSPLNKGVILADEVGLGKTIEAGLVISQYWAERRRKILLILPASLRKQWQQELIEKFSIESDILETKSFIQQFRQGKENPFDRTDLVVISSYNFAAIKQKDISAVLWDLVVIDEAHRLRNSEAKMTVAIQESTKQAGKKILLAATPLQNGLPDLHSLASIIDEHLFGSEYALHSNKTEALRARIQKFCKRTLRKQALGIQFKNRVAMTQSFTPTTAEQELYDQISEYLRRPNLVALPKASRGLITMILRKLLASSTRAIAGTLDGMVKRLEEKAAILLDKNDFEDIDDLEEEWDEDAGSKNDIDPKQLNDELTELRNYAAFARQITTNAKAEALLAALPLAFDKAEQLGATRKAVIFTESRRTQDYLFELLASKYGSDQIVLINGSNSGSRTNEIYQHWREQHRRDNFGTESSKSAEIKAALVDEFRNRSSILLATESAAEGVNLQFCSLLVNYDLPWNPQRVEQRIGRCHRYGQKHDVVVLNFLNKTNKAEERVFQLLNSKFKLFEGLFGASDTILGVLESGVDIEKSIAKIFQQCRTPSEIERHFNELESRFDAEIKKSRAAAEQSLLENVDEEVAERLGVRKNQAIKHLDEHRHCLWQLTRRELRKETEFDDSHLCFRYAGANHYIDWRAAEDNAGEFYKSDGSIAQKIIKRAKNREIPTGELVFNYAGYGGKISALETLIGGHGWLEVSVLIVDSIERQESLIYSSYIEKDGAVTFLDEELCQKMFRLPARMAQGVTSSVLFEQIGQRREELVGKECRKAQSKIQKLLNQERLKQTAWTEDLTKELKREISYAWREVEIARSRAIWSAERRWIEKHKELNEKLNTVNQERDERIRGIENRCENFQSQTVPLLAIRWTIE